MVEKRDPRIKDQAALPSAAGASERDSGVNRAPLQHPLAHPPTHAPQIMSQRDRSMREVLSYGDMTQLPT